MQHSDANDEGDSGKAPRLDTNSSDQEDTTIELREKSASPPQASHIRIDFGDVVSSCSTGGTPSRLGLMDTSINYSFDQNNITIRKSTSSYNQTDFSECPVTK